ncbi:MAG: hypothetical protein MZV70_76180 [Desulfobacterales bacterium]|nr:hypothetical protein [Desulfobacterales bacterium]
MAGIDAAFRATGFFTARVLSGFWCLRALGRGPFRRCGFGRDCGFFFAASFFILLLVRGR